MFTRIYRHMGTAMVFTGSILIVLAFCLNSALKHDGFVIGNPKVIYEYVNAPAPNTITMRNDKVSLMKAGKQVATAAGGR